MANLNETLLKLNGTDNENLKSEINRNVDEIKAKAIATTELKFKQAIEEAKNNNSEDLLKIAKELEQLKTENEKLAKELNPFKAKAKIDGYHSEFVKFGGKKDIDLSDYNLDKFKDDDGKVDWEQFIKKQPALKESKNVDDTPDIIISREELEVQKHELETLKSSSRLKNL